MRSLISVVFMVLFCSVQMTSSASIAVDAAKSKCCGEFTDLKIPVKLVTSFYWTTSTCARRAIVFQTKSGKEFCVDPDSTFVKGQVDKINKRTTV